MKNLLEVVGFTAVAGVVLTLMVVLGFLTLSREVPDPNGPLGKILLAFTCIAVLSFLGLMATGGPR